MLQQASRSMQCVPPAMAASGGNPALHAPKLSGQGELVSEAAIEYFKNGARGTHEKDVFGKMMAPMASDAGDDAAIDNVVVYINTLPDNPAPRTVTEDYDQRSKALCDLRASTVLMGGHAGNECPRLAGISDWYLVTQLKNFKQGIRGAHPKDMLRSARWHRWPQFWPMTRQPVTSLPTSIACDDRHRYNDEITRRK